MGSSKQLKMVLRNSLYSINIFKLFTNKHRSTFRCNSKKPYSRISICNYVTNTTVNNHINDTTVNNHINDTTVNNHINDIINPHEVTLEQARTENNTVTGDIVVNNTKITAGSTADTFAVPFEVKRNNVVTGRLDNNSSNNGLDIIDINNIVVGIGTNSPNVKLDVFRKYR